MTGELTGLVLNVACPSQVSEALKIVSADYWNEVRAEVGARWGKDIYILYHSEKPSVLVECGFISNNEEAALLTDSEYQNKMAFAIALSSIKHLTEREV